MAGLEIKHKRSFRWIAIILWVIILIVLIVVGWFAWRFYTTGQLPPGVAVKALTNGPQVDETPVTPQQVDAYTVPVSHPRYISIPSIGVGETRVYSVDVDKNNVLGTPANISDAAWYDKSATPGSGYGAVLIDAHNGGYTKDGVFAKLSALQTGALVTVERGDGKKFTYKVVSNVTMSLDDVNKYGMQQMMQSADPDKEGLSLITCAGNYIPRLGQFDKRVMVRAVIAS